MTTTVDIVNRALQTIGTRTTVTAAELANETTNEAIQANLILEDYRDDLLRMAPWDCAFNYANLSYITSIPGTPENPTTATATWQKGQPPPPWAYEYQYPVDCLRACWLIPSNNSGNSTGVPITTAVTGGPASFWAGPPVRFKVVVDQFYPVTAAAVSAGGTGYAVGDLITLEGGSISGSVPVGAGAVLRVATLAGSAVATATVVNQINGEATPQGGSYFAPVTGAQAQASTNGSGTGATFTLTFSSTQGDQRVIICNQQSPTLAYVKQITNPNVMDPLFQGAWSQILGAGLAIALTGDKALANARIQLANKAIEEARAIDGNEGLTVNDVTPDWIRARGIDWASYVMGQNAGGFDWGSTWPAY